MDDLASFMDECAKAETRALASPKWDRSRWPTLDALMDDWMKGELRRIERMGRYRSRAVNDNYSNRVA